LARYLGDIFLNTHLKKRKENMMKFIESLSPYAHWFLRIALGSVFLYHGLTKFPNLTGLAQMMQMPVVMVLLVALAEAGGGTLVLIGGFSKDWITRVGGLLIIPVMLGVIFMVHWGRWAFTPSETHPIGGMEFQFTLLMLSLFFVVKGNSINTAGSDS
jgi:putative oxidoreductase